MAVTNSDLNLVFGEGLTGAAPQDYARTSLRKFVRSQDHLSFWKSSATGRVLSAYEALDSYGFQTLFEAVEYGSAVLPKENSEPSSTIKLRREALGLSTQDLRKATGLGLQEIEDAEKTRLRTPIRTLEKICVALGLDERLIGFEKGAGGDAELAVRLKTLGSQTPEFSPRTVTKLAEASWVAQSHARLARDLKIKNRIPLSNKRDSNYGSSGYPVWKHGYWLAMKTREMIGLPADEAIPSMLELCSRLGFPVIQAKLPRRFAGATVANNEQRAIVVNTEGFNSNVWVRRATLAHELAHLLWDPDERLQRLQVEEYSQIQSLNWENAADNVEARANAFSIEFLAPAAATLETFKNAETIESGVEAVMQKFGISATAAKYHIWNITGNKLPLERFVVHDVKPSDVWTGPEDFTLDYFPIDSTPVLRRGEFSAAVVAAEMNGIISEDTAAFYLNASLDAYRSGKGTIIQIFPQYT